MAYTYKTYAKISNVIHELNIPLPWASIPDKPTNFPPTVHNHTLANISDVSAGTLAEATAGTVTGNRTWSPLILKQSIESLSDLNTNNYLTGVSGSGNSTVTFARSGLSSLTWNANHTHTFASLTSIPTTISGYGITDAYTQTQINAKTYLKSDTDNRVVATVPNDYNSKFEIKGLKTNTSIGLTSGATYSGVLGIRGWTDSSGGNAHELAFDGNGGIYHRHGATTAWGAWNKLAYSEDVVALSGNQTIAGTKTFSSTISGTTNGNLTSSSSLDPAKIAQTASYRFVSDTEKNTWNAKEPAISKGTTAQYFRGDMSLATFPTFPSALKNPYTLTIQRNGDNVGTYDGSSAQTINILDTNINNYLTGVTGSGNGAVTFARNGLASFNWDASHTHTASEITVPTASASVLGGIKVGAGLSIASGVLSANSQTDQNFTTALRTKLNFIEDGATNVTAATVSGWGFTTNTGSVVGTGSVNGLAYWTGTNAISSLATATYPSLTELSYVKGVTSAIQTQLSNKADSLHTHSSYNRASTTLSGASVFSNIVVANGIVTSTSTRSLTAANVGAVSTTGTAYDSTRFGGKQLRVGSYTSGASGYITLGY